ncbi:hypothetical protein KYB31_12405 [Clostridium felsineum]|uniref:hypothetical protein n=1 Tax=Clostridium felsineum TaxID=36839 RepID=UPI00214D4DAD|nr:hypothetical protein [Clostridium felsineum]MCR3759774.1 hypothetical protein [Clostridium felsineum]
MAKNVNKDNLVTIKKDKYELSWNIDSAKSSKGEVLKEDTSKLYTEINDSVDEEIKQDKDLNNEDTDSKQKIKETLVSNEKVKTLKDLISTINYKSIFDNTDLQYVVKENDVKEEMYSYAYKFRWC